MIEFACPSCQALIRVADGAAGKRGTCPSCKSKVVVPKSSEAAGESSEPESESQPPAPSNLPFEFKPAENSENFETQDQGVTKDSVPDIDNATAPIIDIKPEDKPGTTVGRSRRRKTSSGGNLVVPLICAAILLGVVGWYFWQTHTGLSPDVVGEVVETPRIPDGLIAFGNVSVEREKFDRVRQSLEDQPLSLVSSTYLADVTLAGNISGIVTKVVPAKGAVCVKISLDGTKVQDYVSDHAKELNEYRMQRIRETADRFIAEWAAAIDAGEREIPHLEDVRNDMALASVVSGFGYHVVAFDGKTASPCVGVDTSGELYFVVKPGTILFIIRGRDLKGDTPGFPGEIVVQVPSTGKTQTKPVEPSSSETPQESEKAEGENRDETMEKKPDGEPETGKPDSPDAESSSQ